METAVIPSQDVNKRILTFRKPNGVYAGSRRGTSRRSSRSS
jgi:hypothetical protein